MEQPEQPGQPQPGQPGQAPQQPPQTPPEHQSPADIHRGGLIKAFKYAFEGLAYTIRSQRNMRIHLVLAALAILAGILLRLAPLEWAALLICIVLVMVGEMLNTTIEAIVDLVSPQWHPLAKRAKDIGAGIVLFFALLSIIIGCLVYIPAFLRIIS